jgi:hypothetical protein
MLSALGGTRYLPGLLAPILRLRISQSAFRDGVMRLLLLLVGLVALSGTSSASALTNPPTLNLSAAFSQDAITPTQVARRRYYRHRSGASRAYRARDNPAPTMVAPPMPPTPQVAPLAPRIN